MATAVDDGLISWNPCRVKDAGQEKSPERPVLTMHQVFVLADDVAEHLEQFTGTADDCLVFTGPKAAQLRRSTARRYATR
jgi:hypothetical protein